DWHQHQIHVSFIGLGVGTQRGIINKITLRLLHARGYMNIFRGTLSACARRADDQSYHYHKRQSYGEQSDSAQARSQCWLEDLCGLGRGASCPAPTMAGHKSTS